MAPNAGSFSGSRGSVEPFSQNCWLQLLAASFPSPRTNGTVEVKPWLQQVSAAHCVLCPSAFTAFHHHKPSTIDVPRHENSHRTPGNAFRSHRAMECTSRGRECEKAPRCPLPARTEDRTAVGSQWRWTVQCSELQGSVVRASLSVMIYGASETVLRTSGWVKPYVYYSLCTFRIVVHLFFVVFPMFFPRFLFKEMTISIVRLMVTTF